MTQLQFEILRATGAADSCSAQLTSAVSALNRRVRELNDALIFGYSMGSHATNVASAAAEVGRIGERLESLKDTVKVLDSLNKEGAVGAAN